MSQTIPFRMRCVALGLLVTFVATPVAAAGDSESNGDSLSEYCKYLEESGQIIEYSKYCTYVIGNVENILIMTGIGGGCGSDVTCEAAPAAQVSTSAANVQDFHFEVTARQLNLAGLASHSQCGVAGAASIIGAVLGSDGLPGPFSPSAALKALTDCLPQRIDPVATVKAMANEARDCASALPKPDCAVEMLEAAALPCSDGSAGGFCPSRTGHTVLVHVGGEDVGADYQAELIYADGTPVPRSYVAGTWIGDYAVAIPEGQDKQGIILRVTGAASLGGAEVTLTVVPEADRAAICLPPPLGSCVGGMAPAYVAHPTRHTASVTLASTGPLTYALPGIGR